MMHWLSQFFCVEIKFRTLEKKINTTTLIDMKFFSTTNGYNLFGHKRYEEILEELKVEPVGEK
jgi:hypothetical protein